MENVDEPALLKYFDISAENFKILCDELRQKIGEGLKLEPEELRERFLELKATKIESPNIEVPDPLQKKNRRGIIGSARGSGSHYAPGTNESCKYL